MPVNPVVLKNKGVPVYVYKTTEPQKVVTLNPADGTLSDPVWEPSTQVLDDDGQPIVEEVWVRFTANTLAEIEERFGTLQEFQKASQEKAFTSVRAALAFALGYCEDHPNPVERETLYHLGETRAGLAMVDGKINDYATAVGAAMSIANGVDPTHVARMVEQGVRAAAEAVAEMNESVAKQLDEQQPPDEPESAPPVDEGTDSTPTAESPGSVGSESSPEPVAL